jgi:hypothetical protein
VSPKKCTASAPLPIFENICPQPIALFIGRRNRGEHGEATETDRRDLSACRSGRALADGIHIDDDVTLVAAVGVDAKGAAVACGACGFI